MRYRSAGLWAGGAKRLFADQTPPEGVDAWDSLVFSPPQRKAVEPLRVCTPREAVARLIAPEPSSRSHRKKYACGPWIPKIVLTPPPPDPPCPLPEFEQKRPLCGRVDASRRCYERKHRSRRKSPGVPPRSPPVTAPVMVLPDIRFSWPRMLCVDDYIFRARRNTARKVSGAAKRRNRREFRSLCNFEEFAVDLDVLFEIHETPSFEPPTPPEPTVEELIREAMETDLIVGGSGDCWRKLPWAAIEDNGNHLTLRRCAQLYRDFQLLTSAPIEYEFVYDPVTDTGKFKARDRPIHFDQTCFIASIWLPEGDLHVCAVEICSKDELFETWQRLGPYLATEFGTATWLLEEEFCEMCEEFADHKRVVGAIPSNAGKVENAVHNTQEFWLFAVAPKLFREAGAWYVQHLRSRWPQAFERPNLPGVQPEVGPIPIDMRPTPVSDAPLETMPDILPGEDDVSCPDSWPFWPPIPCRDNLEKMPRIISDWEFMWQQIRSTLAQALARAETALVEFYWNFLHSLPVEVQFFFLHFKYAFSALVKSAGENLVQFLDSLHVGTLVPAFFSASRGIAFICESAVHVAVEAVSSAHAVAVLLRLIALCLRNYREYHGADHIFRRALLAGELTYSIEHVYEAVEVSPLLYRVPVQPAFRLLNMADPSVAVPDGTEFKPISAEISNHYSNAIKTAKSGPKIILPEGTHHDTMMDFARAFPEYALHEGINPVPHPMAAAVRRVFHDRVNSAARDLGTPLVLVGGSLSEMTKLNNVVHNCAPILSGRDYKRYFVKAGGRTMYSNGCVNHKFQDCDHVHPGHQIVSMFSAHDIPPVEFITKMVETNCNRAYLALNLPFPLLDLRVKQYTDLLAGFHYEREGDDLFVFHVGEHSAGYKHSFKSVLAWMQNLPVFEGVHVQMEALGQLGTSVLLQLDVAPGAQEVVPTIWDCQRESFYVLPELLGPELMKDETRHFAVPARRFEQLVAYVSTLNDMDRDNVKVAGKVRGLMAEVRVGKHTIDPRWSITIAQFHSLVSHALICDSIHRNSVGKQVKHLLGYYDRVAWRHGNFAQRYIMRWSDLLHFRTNGERDPASTRRDFSSQTRHTYNPYSHAGVYRLVNSEKRSSDNLLPSVAYIKLQMSKCAAFFKGKGQVEEINEVTFIETQPEVVVDSGYASPERATTPPVEDDPELEEFRRQLHDALETNVDPTQVALPPSRDSFEPPEELPPLDPPPAEAPPDTIRTVELPKEPASPKPAPETFVAAPTAEPDQPGDDEADDQPIHRDMEGEEEDNKRMTFIDEVDGEYASSEGEASTVYDPEINGFDNFIESRIDMMRTFDPSIVPDEIQYPVDFLAPIQDVNNPHDLYFRNLAGKARWRNNKATGFAPMLGAAHHIKDIFAEIPNTKLLGLLSVFPAGSASACYRRLLRRFTTSGDSEKVKLINAKTERFLQAQFNATELGPNYQFDVKLLHIAGPPMSAKSSLAREYAMRYCDKIVVYVPSNKLADEWSRAKNAAGASFKAYAQVVSRFSKLTVARNSRTTPDLGIIDEVYNFSEQELYMHIRSLALAGVRRILLIGDPFQNESGSGISKDSAFFNHTLKLHVSLGMPRDAHMLFKKINNAPEHFRTTGTKRISIYFGSESAKVEALVFQPHSNSGGIIEGREIRESIGTVQGARAVNAYLWADVAVLKAAWLTSSQPHSTVAVTRHTSRLYIQCNHAVADAIARGLKLVQAEFVNGRAEIVKPLVRTSGEVTVHHWNNDASTLYASNLDARTGVVFPGDVIEIVNRNVPSEVSEMAHVPVVPLQEVQNVILSKTNFEIEDPFSRKVEADHGGTPFRFQPPSFEVYKSDVRSRFDNAHLMAAIHHGASAVDNWKNLLERQLAPSSVKSPNISTSQLREGMLIYQRFKHCYYANEATIYPGENYATVWMASREQSALKIASVGDPLFETSRTLVADAEFKTQSKAKAQPGFAATLPYGQSIIANGKVFNARFANEQPKMYQNLPRLLRPGAILDYGMTDDELSELLRSLGVAHEMNGKYNIQCDLSKQDSSHSAPMLIAFCLIALDCGLDSELVDFYLEYCTRYSFRARTSDATTGSVSFNLGSGDPFTLIRNDIMEMCVIACYFEHADKMIIVEKGDDVHGVLYNTAASRLRSLSSIKLCTLKLEFGAVGYHAGRFHNGHRYIVDPVRAFMKHNTKLRDENVPDIELWRSYHSRATDYSHPEVEFLYSACAALYDFFDKDEIVSIVDHMLNLREPGIFLSTLSEAPKATMIDTKQNCLENCVRVLRPGRGKAYYRKFRLLHIIDAQYELERAGIPFVNVEAYPEALHDLPVNVILLTSKHARLLFVPSGKLPRTFKSSNISSRFKVNGMQNVTSNNANDANISGGVAALPLGNAVPIRLSTDGVATSDGAGIRVPLACSTDSASLAGNTHSVSYSFRSHELVQTALRIFSVVELVSVRATIWQKRVFSSTSSGVGLSTVRYGVAPRALGDHESDAEETTWLVGNVPHLITLAASSNVPVQSVSTFGRGGSPFPPGVQLDYRAIELRHNYAEFYVGQSEVNANVSEARWGVQLDFVVECSGINFGAPA